MSQAILCLQNAQIIEGFRFTGIIYSAYRFKVMQIAIQMTPNVRQRLRQCEGVQGNYWKKKIIPKISLRELD